MKLKGLILSLSLSLVSFASSAMEWEWLDAMRVSVQEQNYRGEYIHRRGDQTNVFSIVHRFADGKSTELLRQLDGDLIEVVREGARSVCFYPEGSESSMSDAVPAAPFSQVGSLDLDMISKNYKAMSSGEERVIGFNTHVVTLIGDDWRYSQRLWLEVNTNLLLQSELVDVNGEVLEQFRFTRLEVGLDIDDADLVPTQMKEGMRQQTVYRSVEEKVDADSFMSTVGWLPSGFKLTHGEIGKGVDGWSEQRTYSDGLSSFSVFIEQNTRLQEQVSVMAKMGATSAFMATDGKLGITIIGEVPFATAQKVAQEVSLRAASL